MMGRAKAKIKRKENAAGLEKNKGQTKAKRRKRGGKKKNKK